MSRNGIQTKLLWAGIIALRAGGVSQAASGRSLCLGRDEGVSTAPALAEWHCGTPDRHLASRVLGSNGDL